MMAISEIGLVLGLPFFLIRTKADGWRRLRNPLWIAIFSYLLVCLASMIANGSLLTGLTSFLQMCVYVVICVFVFSVCLSDIRQVVAALYTLMIACAFLAIMVGATGSNYVLGLHKNLIGTEVMYSVIIGFELWMARIAERRPRILLTVILCILVIGLVMTRSRGAWIGTSVGILAILLVRRQFGMALRALLLLVPLVASGWFMLNDQAREAAMDLGTNSKFGSAGARLVSIEYAFDIFKHSPIFGAGVGLRKEYDATNVIMSTLAETGFAGLVTFLSIFGTLLFMAWRAQKRINRQDPVFSLMAMGVGLMLGKFIHGCVDHYWSRGVIPVWAGAGFVAYAYVYARSQTPSDRLRMRV